MKKYLVVIGFVALIGVLGFQQWQIHSLKVSKLDKVVKINIFSEQKSTPLEMRSFAETVVNLIYEGQKQAKPTT